MEGLNERGTRAPGPEPAGPGARERVLDGALGQVARGDKQAFETLYDGLAGPVYGLISQVLRDPAQSEEVSQEVMLEVWRAASRFDPARGNAATWVLTIAHRRAVDRVRSASAAAARERRAAGLLFPEGDATDPVEAGLVREGVRRCLDGLTELQRESITLAYYGGYSYRQVAVALDVTLSTIKARIRTGLLRMRSCLGVQW